MRAFGKSVYLKVSGFIFLHRRVSSLFRHICLPFGRNLCLHPPSPNFDNLKKSVPDYRAHLWVGAREEEGGREAEQNNHFRRLTMPPARKKGLPGCRLAGKKGLKDDGEASSLSSAEEEGPIFLSQYSQS